VKRFLVNTTIRVILRIITRVRVIGLDRVPFRGPLIIAINHINFLEVPLLYMVFRPRRVIGMAKVEAWDHPVFGIVARLWEAIPLHRGQADTAAFAQAEAELEGGGIVAVAPEGTRTRTGRLRRASAGIITLAARTGAPILPIAHYGGERLSRNLKRLRRTRVTVRVGQLMTVERHVRADEGLAGASRQPGLTKAERDENLQALMVAIARLLPPEYRGYYAEAAEAPGGQVPGGGAATTAAPVGSADSSSGAPQ
jgi:1-acyl-sn-glycerol-3-phosphate acyltransferase